MVLGVVSALLLCFEKFSSPRKSQPADSQTPRIVTLQEVLRHHEALPPTARAFYEALLAQGEVLAVQVEYLASLTQHSGEDWTNVKLAVVSGRPISFITELYQPRYIQRPTAELAENRAVGPVVYEGALEKAGMQIVAEEVVARGATTATPQMQKIRAANPEAMFLAGVLTAENVLIFRAYKELGVKFPIHSSYNLSVPIYETVAKGLVNGITFVDAYDPDKPEVKAFVAAYKKATGKDSQNLHGYGYDGINLIADAIRRAGSTDKEKIREAMQKTNYAGVMGKQGMKYSFPEGKRAGFDPDGMVVRVYENDRQGKVLHVGQK